MNGERGFILTLMIALAGASGVALGAFGAHALAESLEVAGMTSVWNTAVSYHLLHAVAAFAAMAGGSSGGHTRFRVSVCLWLLGMVLFSGSLYILALGGPGWLGPITPLGGLALMAGWLAAGIAALGARRARGAASN